MYKELNDTVISGNKSITFTKTTKLGHELYVVIIQCVTIHSTDTRIQTFYCKDMAITAFNKRINEAGRTK